MKFEITNPRGIRGTHPRNYKGFKINPHVMRTDATERIHVDI